MFQHYVLAATFFFIQLSVVGASYCGQAAIPYSLEILETGQPVLGCARPSCFGWTANGTRAADPAQFYRIGKQPDGFFRTSDVKGPEVKNATGFQPQYSICDRSYLSDQCAGSSWIGGIAPSATIEKDKPMKLICCYYNKLMDATGQGRVELRAGQAVKGGETKNDAGRQNGFEYVANVQRLFDRSSVVYVVTMKKFSCVAKPPDNMNIGVDSEVTTFLIENINALSATTTQLPPSIMSKSFNEQIFDLPESMPAEENRLENMRSVAGKAQGAKSSPMEQPIDYAINQEPEDESVLVNFGTGATRSTKNGGGVLPKAKAMENDEAEDDYEKDAETMERMNDAAQPHNQQQQQPLVAVGDYYSQYQQKLDSHRTAEYKEEKQQQLHSSGHQHQPQHQYAYAQQNPLGYQSQQPAQQAPQHHTIVNNNNNGYNGGYYQQPVTLYNSALDPLSIFRQLTIGQQQQQQYGNNNFYTNNNNNQNAGSTYGQQQYQPLVSGNYDGQRAYVAQTLATPTLLNSFTAPAFVAPQRSYADGDMISPHNSGSAASESPQLRIPTPEEVESAIPPVGRRLLASVTRTLFGYHFK